MLLFALTALVLLGWGSLVIRLFRMRLESAEMRFSQLWLGLAIVLLWLQLLHYFTPINWIVTAALAVGGLVAWWLHWRKSPRLPFAAQRLVPTILFSLAVWLSAWWIALQAMQPVTNVDSGTYQLQSIRWLNEYAIVPGLGNLFGRLALNQAFLAFAAALNFYPYFNLGYALANGFLSLLLAMEGWHALILRRGERSLAHFATLCALPIAAYMVLRLNPASPSPTTASSILQVVIWLYCARLFFQSKVVGDGSGLDQEAVHEAAQIARTRAHVILTLAATVLTFHLSNLVFVTVIALMVLIRNWFSEPHPLLIRGIILFRLTWLCNLMLIIWAGRGYFLSGYLAYPSTLVAFGVDWAVPPMRVEAEANLIEMTAKSVRGGLAEGSWAWVGSWLAGLVTGDGITQLLYPLLLTLILWIAFWGVREASRRGEIHPASVDAQENKARPAPYALLTLPLVMALIAWWLTTPDPALVHSLFWMLPILVAHKLLVTLQGVEWRATRVRQLVPPALFLLVNGAMLVSLLLNGQQAVMVLPKFAPLPQPMVVEETLPRRLSVLIPVDDQHCWNTLLPCSPYADPQLRKRGTDLQQGFRVLSPYNSSLAMQNPSITLCQPLPFIPRQHRNFAWVACGKQKG